MNPTFLRHYKSGNYYEFPDSETMNAYCDIWGGNYTEVSAQHIPQNAIVHRILPKNEWPLLTRVTLNEESGVN